MLTKGKIVVEYLTIVVIYPMTIEKDLKDL